MANIDAAGSPPAPRPEGNLGPILISTIVTVSFFVTLDLLIVVPLQEGSKSILEIMCGVLGSNFSMVVGYWIGSTAGSKRKDEMVRSMAASSAAVAHAAIASAGGAETAAPSS